MNPEGRVIIDMRDTAAPSVRFERPGDIARILRGKTRNEATGVIPVIYSICGMAQAHAAACALDAALDNYVDGQTDLARQALVSMESLREHLLRIMLDWPGFSGKAPRAREAAPVMQFTTQMIAALFKRDPFALDAVPKTDPSEALSTIGRAEILLGQLVFGGTPGDWLEVRGRDGLADCAAGAGTVAGDFIASLLQRDEADMAAVPAGCREEFTGGAIADWLAGGAAAGLEADGFDEACIPETTLYSRHFRNGLLESLGGSGLLVRHVARLVELAELPSRVRDLLAGKGMHTETMREDRGGISYGMSRVTAARGDLVHAAAMRDGRITEYAIFPPTLWNFHGDGVAAHCLSAIGKVPAEQAERLGRLIVNAVDPCVGYELRVA